MKVIESEAPFLRKGFTMKQVFNVLEIFGWDVALLCFLFNIPALKLLNYIREDKLPPK